MKILTTGQVAKICKVAVRTVIKWFDSGRLKGYRIPGSFDRRIPREYLIKFLKEHGMPLGDLEDEMTSKVLVASQDPMLTNSLKTNMPERDGFKVRAAMSAFDAGIQAQGFRPDAVVVDFAIGKDEAMIICQGCCRLADSAEVILVALLPEHSAWNPAQGLANETFKKLFDPALLAQRLLTLIGAKKELV